MVLSHSCLGSVICAGNFLLNSQNPLMAVNLKVGFFVWLGLKEWGFFYVPEK